MQLSPFPFPLYYFAKKVLKILAKFSLDATLLTGFGNPYSNSPMVFTKSTKSFMEASMVDYPFKKEKKTPPTIDSIFIF